MGCNEVSDSIFEEPIEDVLLVSDEPKDQLLRCLKRPQNLGSITLIESGKAAYGVTDTYTAADASFLFYVTAIEEKTMIELRKGNYPPSVDGPTAIAECAKASWKEAVEL